MNMLLTTAIIPRSNNLPRPSCGSSKSLSQKKPACGWIAFPITLPHSNRQFFICEGYRNEIYRGDDMSFRSYKSAILGAALAAASTAAQGQQPKFDMEQFEGTVCIQDPKPHCIPTAEFQEFIRRYHGIELEIHVPQVRLELHVPQVTLELKAAKAELRFKQLGIILGRNSGNLSPKPGVVEIRPPEIRQIRPPRQIELRSGLPADVPVRDHIPMDGPAPVRDHIPMGPVVRPSLDGFDRQ